MALTNVQILRQYHHTPCKFESTLILIITRFRSATALVFIVRLKSRGNAKQYSGRPGLGSHPAGLSPPERRHLALPAIGGCEADTGEKP